MQYRQVTLFQSIVERTRRAIACGALRPIETEQGFVEEEGVRFLVRRVSSLRRKDEERARTKTKERVNPFLPYEEDLFVADISDTHIGLLNKFNVIDNHLLIVTRGFVDQETLLDIADFQALLVCMADFEGLGFYNGGVVAGASQPHKHLQLVPLPMAGEGPAVPIEPRLAAGLPFRHALAWLQPEADAATLHGLYHHMLEKAGIAGVGSRQSAPYNLLLTRCWMLLVPRSQEFYEGISINALGYAGSLFVRDERQMRMIRERGPMTVLRHVSVEAG